MFVRVWSRTVRTFEPCCAPTAVPEAPEVPTPRPPRRSPSDPPPRPAPDGSAERDRQEALLKTGALQNAILNSENFSSIATDDRGVIQIFNVGAERMLGYSKGEVLNRITPADISDPDEVVARAEALSLELGTPIRPGFEALVFKASRGIEDIYELTYIRKDGSRFPAIVSVTALRDADGRIIGYLLIGTDNTARKRVEAEQQKLDQQLRDQQFYTRSLIESNTDALLATDPDGILTDVNTQMEALTGRSRAELIGTPFKQHFTDPALAEQAIRRALSETKVVNHELLARGADGRETLVSCNATTFYDRERRLQGVFASARDVTVSKRLERSLQEKNVELDDARVTAEQASRAKSQFLSSMSHELRSPLNAILGFAQLMESDVPPPNESQRASIEQILHAGWYLLELINEILDLAVIESGKLSLSHEPVALDEVLLECRAMIEPEAARRGIRLSFPDAEGLVLVRADRTRLKQIVINLLSNAMKYNRPAGEIEAAFEVATNGRVRTRVRDTGAGLSPPQLKQLFQAFNRLGREGSAEEGTGIGLVTSKLLVEMMGGTIGAESEPGVGSTFWFELEGAIADGLVAEEEFPGQADQPLAPPILRTLLYVEDNPANLRLVERLVARRAGLRLFSAGDARTGIDLARQLLPDVILMDINLPGMNGIEALGVLRADPSTAAIPVLAISANAMRGDISYGLEAGFFRYLTKPIRVPEFLEALDLAFVAASAARC